MRDPTDDYRLSADEAGEIEVRAGSAFQPRTPISTKELFSGRWDQITTLADAVSQTGLHVVIHGERGVGKTSLANVVRPVLHVFDGDERLQERVVIKVNAHTGDSFSSIWTKVFDEIAWSDDQPAFGFAPGHSATKMSVREAFNLPNTLTVDHVRRTLSFMGDAVFIIDEFDRAVAGISVQFTDLIKALSDFAIGCTVMVVGVSDTVADLIENHASIGRALVEIHLPRMNPKELRDILTKAEETLNMSFKDDAATLIVHMSQGLPHYTHLLGLHSVRLAARRQVRQVEAQDVYDSFEQAVKQAQQSVTEKHSKAVHSAHPDALYRHVLLACAVTASKATDQLGYFYPAAIARPLAAILKRTDVQIATFNNHLTEFCQTKRAGVLERTGQPRAYRFRFRDPLVVPYTFMDAIASSLVTADQLQSLLRGEN